MRMRRMMRRMTRMTMMVMIITATMPANADGEGDCCDGDCDADEHDDGDDTRMNASSRPSTL